VQVQPMSVMRRKIAEHMIYSRRTSAHVHSVFEVDFTRVAAVRQAQKAEFERAGVKLTYLAFIAKAIADALRTTPVVNAAIDGDNVAYKKDVNLGFAVALDWGLIVPVVHKADEKSLLGIARGIADVAARARAKQLRPEDVQGGTFTITNPGSFGTLFGMPIINQPQVAILGIGTIEKRVVVIDDMIAIRQRGYLTLGYDHRLVDGAVADQFMSKVKAAIESWT
jgi:2-oxoglutarate dehydrogenase E2 component (dihydrolipoamide succinyltransferase)